MAQVHYWELSNYNAGKLIGKWFDLDGRTHDDHLAELAEWLEELTEETGELCEEWILGDVEDVPSRYVDTYGIDPEFFEYQAAIESSHLDAEVIEAGIELGIPLDKIEDAYYGQFESDEDLAWEHIESGCMGDIPDHLINYIDMERLGRDLAMDFMEHNGHYFYSNW